MLIHLTRRRRATEVFYYFPLYLRVRTSFPFVRCRRHRASVTMTTYNPISENLIATEPGNGGEAKCNCVAARLGGKQPGAKEQSQTKVNSIRCWSAASLLANGEACAKRNLCPWHPPANADHRADMYGWSENASKEICVNGESCMSRHWGQPQAMQQSEPPYEQRSPVTRMEQREVGK